MRGILGSSFRIGDKVVYPNHGVGVIEQVALRSNGFITERYYLLNIRASNLKVQVPCQNATAVGLRGLVCEDEMVRILRFLSQNGENKNADWKERYREHMDKMKAGTLMEVAEVLKSLLAAASGERAQRKGAEAAGAGAVSAGERDVAGQGMHGKRYR